ncbi:hypothetical protein PRUB_a2403 [Pseudoalteromonas rubra]|uniref:Uncharacterized protein n=1 Tax=Pseudoalteromonas rubra TaxID=43658 RepID=A0A8T0CAU7_9GAMM|nr:hypothetical protein PRUB_a2403 [Pseudoalteromonas rubra]
MAFFLQTRFFILVIHSRQRIAFCKLSIHNLLNFTVNHLKTVI